MSKKSFVILLLIVLFGSLLRFYDIENNPKGIYGDELTAVYDAYSLLKTGMDQKGNSWPLVFELGGSRPPGYVYATIPFVAIFGPNALSARAVSILSGIGLIIVLFFLGKLLLNERLGLIIAFLAAVSPWSLSISRGGFESNFALFVATFATFAFLKGVKEHKWFLLSAILFALSMQTYPTYRLTIPIFLAFLLMLNKNIILQFKKPIVVFGTIIFISSFLLSLFLTFGRGKDDRFTNINIFSNPEINTNIITKINSERGLSSLHGSYKNFFHNRFLEYTQVFSKNYLSNFSLDFLFLQGDKIPRHNGSEMSGFYITEIIFMIAGVGFLLKKDKKLLIFILGWVFIAPLATAFVSGAHALRSSFMLPPLLLFSGFGVYAIFYFKKIIWQKLIVVLLIIFFLANFLLFSERFFFLSANKFYNFWSYPAKEASRIALKNKDRFDAIFLSGNISNMEYAYPVYAKIDPKHVISANNQNTYIGEYRFLKYENVYIGALPYGRIKEFLNNYPGSVLYIGDGENELKYMENYTLIRGLDNMPSLVIFSKGAEVLN